MNDCQIDSCDHCSVHLNSEVVGLCVAGVVVAVVVVALAATEAENAEMAVGMGQDCLHLNLHSLYSM